VPIVIKSAAIIKRVIDVGDRRCSVSEVLVMITGSVMFSVYSVFVSSKYRSSNKYSQKD